MCWTCKLHKGKQKFIYYLNSIINRILNIQYLHFKNSYFYFKECSYRGFKQDVTWWPINIFLCKYITYSSSGLYKHGMLRPKFCQLQHLDLKCSTLSAQFYYIWIKMYKIIVIYCYISCIFFLEICIVSCSKINMIKI